MSAASTKIMAGDLSQRLPVGWRVMKFDRLRNPSTPCLERIEKLNEGLRSGFDNIAHDLKTPLTRLRKQGRAMRWMRIMKRCASRLWKGLLPEI